MKRKPASSKSTSTESRRAAALLGACVLAHGSALGATFGDEAAFLQKHTSLVLLSDATGKAKVAVAPAWQGRVMTSTAAGDQGRSFGWINRELIASRKIQPHINVFGGEDRFWMGPEGGQFSIFFAKGVPFDLEHWFTPASLDTEPFEVGLRRDDRVELHRRFSITNYSATRFDVRVDRHVQLLSPAQAWKQLGIQTPLQLDVVAFESVNRLQNTGAQPWTRETGLLSIWILGMFNPSPSTTIVVPIKAGSEQALGKAVTSDYFGPVPPERLIVKDNVIFFSADGQFRSKIGINPRRAKPVLGSYDAANKVLTLVQFTLPQGESSYVNSKWELQSAPFSGDAVNSYNDGPPSPGAKPLGPFYELESSSPAAALEPGKFIEHIHRTMHLTGSSEQLDKIARATLGVGVHEIETALPRP